MSNSQNVSSLIGDIERITKDVRNKAKLSIILSTAIILGATIVCFWAAKLGVNYGVLIGSVLSLVFLLINFGSKSYRSISLKNMVEHLNRHIPEYEESLQLAFSEKLNSLQTIQLHKVSAIFSANVKGGAHKKLIPAVEISSGLKAAVLIVIVTMSASYLSDHLKSVQLPGEISGSDASSDNSVVKVSAAHILIQPPSYTGVVNSTQKELDLRVLESSKVEWRVSFSSNEPEYFWIGSDGTQHALRKTPDGSWSYETELEQTGFYRFAYKTDDKMVTLPDVYIIEVVRDKVPRIKIQAPSQSLVEFAKNDPTQFTLSALINDDYGVEQVDILASVAKGSGESVKFRDKQFKFDSQTLTEQGALYTKTWSLPELDMEPGDEVYFHIKAKDNKQPKAQWAKSTSIIIRWLDNKVVETAAEGIQIRFIPEYFRSQRQIIIETEQLIADKADLNKTSFDDKSRDLGHSQSDLKEKYGQYLGDEFGEGPGEQFGLADGYHGGEDVAHGEAGAGLDHSNHDHSENKHPQRDSFWHLNLENEGIEEKSLEEKGFVKNSLDQQTGEPKQNVGHNHAAPEVGHLHEEMVDESDKSGASELIARFAHNHGSAEVGPLSNRDPKTWMKLAVHQMWQAELYLMLSEPEKALPFEYKAYDYLKLARQADKIYVKRLGFEPPPVKEDRRLTGELDKILTYSLSVTDKREASIQNDIVQNGFTALNQVADKKQLSKDNADALRALSGLMLELSETRPALVRYAATIENVLSLGSTQLNNCKDCIAKLNQKLWQLISSPVNRPSSRNPKDELDLETINSYQSLIQQVEQSEVVRASDS